MTTYTAFLSYRRSDGTKTANWLRNTLQAFRPPKSMRKDYPNRIRVFLDTAYERGAHDFYEKTIQPALLASRYLLVIATPDAASRGGRVEDDWMAREIADFSAGPNAQNLIIIRAAGEFDGPLPGNLKQAYPNAQIIDLRGVTESNPLYFGRAAFFDNEKLKIVAALLEIPLADMPLLRREEERRRQSRIGFVGGLTAAALATSIGVSVYSIRAQMRGQQSLDQSLASVDSIVLQSASGRWNGAGYKREPNEFVRIACNIANQLVVEAKETRNPTAQAVCDLEYLLNFVSGTEPSEQQREFARSEFDRLTRVADAHFSGIDIGQTPTVPNLNAKDSSGKLTMDVLVNRNLYFAVPDAEAAAAEFALARTIGRAIEAVTERVTDDEDVRRTAVDHSGRWFELASLQYYNRLFSALEAGKGAGDDTLLRQLVDLDASIESLAKKKLAQPVVDSFRTNLFLCLMMTESQATDPKASATLLQTAEGVLDSMPAEVQGSYRLRLQLRQWEIRLAATGSEENYDSLDLFLTAMDRPGLLDGARDSDKQEHSRIRSQLVDAMHGKLDDMRFESERLQDAGDLVAARGLIVAEMAKRADLYIRSDEKSDWSQIWMLLGDARIAAIDARTGKARDADVRRRAVFGELVKKAFSTSVLTSDQADSLRALRNEINRDHHSYLDTLLNDATAAANAGDYTRATAVLKQLRADDRAWDILKADIPASDRVYSLETGLQLASCLDRQNLTSESREVRLRAIGEFLPVLEATLDPAWKQRSETAWQTAQAWLAANAISPESIEAIETLAGLPD